jgi:glutathione S-transferase
MSPLKLYGVPLSQPFRSVAWTLLLRQLPFEIQLTVPGAKSKIGSLNEDFLAKTKGRTGKVPLLEDGQHAISESCAILTYICEKYHGENLYGLPGTEQKALIDSYMHWHHGGTRQLAKLARPYLRPELKTHVTDQDRENAAAVLESLDRAWLQGDDEYIASSKEPTIADILAYEEITQVTMTGALEGINDYPNLILWMKRMSCLPYHEEIHISLKVLGNLPEPSDTPMQKRLGAATKAGVAAIMEAQESMQASKL